MTTHTGEPSGGLRAVSGCFMVNTETATESVIVLVKVCQWKEWISMRLAILQPGYLPWLGYFDQMRQVDVFVHATTLQYTRQDWRSRNRIKTREGWQWLTVPVKSKGQFHARINEIKINNDLPWAVKHMNIIRQNYCKAPYYKPYAAILEDAYQRRWEYLVELDLYLINCLKQALDIETKLIDIAHLNIGETGKNQRLIEVCLKFNADTYVSGAAARSYINEELFVEAGIAVEYQDYRHPIYPQLHGVFIPNLSIIDLLFNCGEQSLAVLSNRHEMRLHVDEMG